MLVIKFTLLSAIARQYLRRQYLFHVLDVNQMRDNLSLFQETDERNGGHFFVLQLNLSMGKKHPIFPFETPIVFFNVDQIQIFHFLLEIRQSSYCVFHEHFSIDLIKDHYSVKLLSKQLIIQTVLVKFVVVIDFLTQLIQKHNELFFLDNSLKQRVKTLSLFFIPFRRDFAK